MPRTIEFTDTEFMIAQGARLIEDGKTIFVGWGIPQVVAMLAQKLYVPNVTQLFEFGAIGPQSVLPFVRGTMGGPQNTYRSLQWLNMNWAFSYSATGYMDYGMLGALQVDPYGNINSTYLGGTFANPDAQVRRERRRKPGGLALLEDDHRHQARGAPVRPEGRFHHLPGVPRRSGGPREGGAAPRYGPPPRGHLEGAVRVRRADPEDDPPLGPPGAFGGRGRQGYGVPPEGRSSPETPGPRRG